MCIMFIQENVNTEENVYVFSQWLRRCAQLKMPQSTVFHSCGKNRPSGLTEKLFPGGRHLPTVLHSLFTSFISALAYNVLFLEEVINQGRFQS